MVQQRLMKPVGSTIDVKVRSLPVDLVSRVSNDRSALACLSGQSAGHFEDHAPTGEPQILHREKIAELN